MKILIEKTTMPPGDRYELINYFAQTAFLFCLLRSFFDESSDDQLKSSMERLEKKPKSQKKEQGKKRGDKVTRGL